MKWLILWLVPVSAWAVCTPRTGYSFCATLTQVHTQNGASDSANFPVGVIGTANGSGTGAFSGSNVDLRTVANGGKIQNTVTGYLVSAQYQSGGTLGCTIGQTITLSSFNGSLSGATGTLGCTGTNVIAAKTPVIITAPGSGGTSVGQATCGNGTGTCSGTITFGSAGVSVTGPTAPADFVVTSDSAGTALLPFEVASYSATTGAIQLYVKLSISHTSDTLFYISFGNASVTAFQGNVTGVWSGFISVLHFENVTLASGKIANAFDSTTNQNHFANNSSDVTQTASGVAGSAYAPPNPATNNSVLVGSGANNSGFNNYTTGSSVWTYESWVNHLGIAFSSNERIGGWGGGSTGQVVLLNSCANGGDGGCVASQCNGSDLYASVCGAGQRVAFTPDSNWHQLVSVFPSGTTAASLLFYIDGVLSSSTTISGSTTVNIGSGSGANIGAGPGATGNNFKGNEDEVRISNVARSADWVLAEFNNLNSPGSFVTVSNASTGAGNMPPAIF